MELSALSHGLYARADEHKVVWRVFEFWDIHGFVDVVVVPAADILEVGYSVWNFLFGLHIVDDLHDVLRMTAQR